MLNIYKYLDVLPDEVLVNGEFCVTKIGDKQPYDPFKDMAISAKDQFYSIEKIAEVDTEKYDTIGIKVGNGISVIDIDDVVNKSTGEIDPVAMEIILFMESYTELSPSGTGIRILFEAENKFDRDAYKTKNSSIGLEYYDADDQETYGGRMARLSGDVMMPYPYRKVDTSELLDKYMSRINYSRIAELESGTVDDEYVDLVYVLIATSTHLKNLFNREVFENYESDADLIIVNAIAEYTRNPVEINNVFKKTRYYRTKGIKSDKARHKDKWDGEYGWNTIAMANPQIIKLEYKPRVNLNPGKNDLIVAGVKWGLLHKSDFKDVDTDITLEYQRELDALYKLAQLRINRVSAVKMIKEME